VVVDGRPLPGAERTRLFLYHKPSGLVTTSADPQGRPTIFDSLPKDLPRLISVGRLDLSTEGLLLLTNDGGLARALELPATAWLRRYRVRAYGKVAQAQLDALRDGVTVEGIRYGPIDAQLDREQTSNVWITFAIREGKNREVRNVLRHLGLQVSRLIRVSFGPFQLGDIVEGDIAEVPTRILRDQLGEKLAKAAGADFSAPIVERESRHPEERASKGREPRRATATQPPSFEGRKERPPQDDGKRNDRKVTKRAADRPKKKTVAKSPFHRPSRGEGAKPSFDERAPKRGGHPKRGKR
jgi:23S rRNA pseudouridine2605 synthase